MYLYSLKKQGAAAILDSLIQANSIADSVGSHLPHSITCLQPVCLNVPRFDCENLGDSETLEQTNFSPASAEGYKYLCLGLNIGSLVFVSLDNLQRIYCRLSVVNRHVGHFIEIGTHMVCCSGAGGQQTNS
jgi:hypothetical protein